MMDYRESCNHKVSMYSVNRIVDAFCAYVCKSRDCGRISAESADRQIDVANDVAMDFEDRKATAKTYADFAKIRDFNRKHGLAA